MVVITGTGFTGATKVTFGRRVRPPVHRGLRDPDHRDLTGLGHQGIRHIRVTTPSGTSAAVDADLYTYTGVPPAITGIAPASGPTTGGTVVVITGTGFTGATKVTFGQAGPATSFTVDSATQITATSPASATKGIRNIRVTTPSGTSAAVDADLFTYTGVPPAITGIAPALGSGDGGTVVVITGTGFTGATKVTFGQAARATSFHRGLRDPGHRDLTGLGHQGHPQHPGDHPERHQCRRGPPTCTPGTNQISTVRNANCCVRTTRVCPETAPRSSHRTGQHALGKRSRRSGSPTGSRLPPKSEDRTRGRPASLWRSANSARTDGRRAARRGG